MNELAIDVLQALIHGVILRIKRHQEIGAARQSDGKEECGQCGGIARIMKSCMGILWFCQRNMCSKQCLSDNYNCTTGKSTLNYVRILFFCTNLNKVIR